MKRRIFAIVLSCLMVLSVLPVAAFAEDAVCEHEYVETVLKAPTCEEEGVKKITCKKCDLKATYEKIDAHPLNEGTVIEAATCGEAGSIKYACTVCDYTIVKDIPATGEHTYDDGVIGATCDKPAMAGSICTGCGIVEPETELEAVEGSEALGCDWVLDKTAEGYVAADCVKPGVNTYKCSRCGKTKTEDTEATGHDWDAGVLKNATCDYAQHVLYTCKTCGETKAEETGLEGSAALGHDWVDDKVVAPTCTDEGYTLQKCKRCSATQEINKQEATGHDYYEKVVAPTCKVEGYTLKLCNKCDFSEEVVDSKVPVDADAHTPVKGTVLKEATCDTPGVAKSVCADCGATLGYIGVEADHTWDKGVVVTPNTCDKDGEMKYTCTGCGEEKTEAIPAGHDEKYVVVEAGNCGKDGKMTVTCSRCDYTADEVIKATGDHKFVEKTVAATCTSPAMAGIACEVCNTAKGELSVVEGSKPLGHDEIHTYVPATCTAADGEQITCSRCDYKEYVEIGINKALGHDWKAGEVVKPTCTENGYTPYVCTRCDATTKNLKPEEDVAKLGHDWKTVTTAATCSATGKVEKLCKTCGVADEEFEVEILPINSEAHKKVQASVLQPATCTTPGVAKMACEYCEKALGYEAIPAGHKWDEGTVTTPATCDKDGVKTFACTVCGANPTEAEIAASKLNTVVPAGHKLDKGTVTTAATCGKDGVKTFKCANCDYTETEKIPATGKHDYKETIVPATCDDVSYVASKCTVCGDVKSKTAVEGSVALGHNFKETLLAADCTNAQRVKYECTRCDYSYTENTNIPGTGALGHKWDDGVVFDPECGVKGYTLYTCGTCGETEKRDEVPALEHEFVATTTPATCAKEGKVEMICKHCKEIKEDAEVEVIPKDPNNHTPVQDKVLQEPTCDAYGVEKLKCKDCGAGLGYKAIDPAHKMDDGKITTAATCTKPGVKTFSCTVCDYSYTEAIEAGHKYNDGVVTKPATCGKDGVMTYTCTVCSATTEGHSYTEAIPATGEHNFAEIIIPADCENPAKAGIACTVCGTPETVLTVVTGSKPLGHDFKDELLAADCLYGQRVHTTCSRCDYDKTEETGLEDKVGHKITKFAPNSENGKHKGMCSVCKKIVTENCTVEETVTIPANCQSGTKVVGDCTVCGKSTVVSVGADKNLENHNYGIETVLVPATCDSDGISKFTCECDKDGKVYVYRVTTKAHAWGEDLVNDDSTAVYHVCSVCGTEEIIQKFPGYVCKEHTEIEVISGVDATCNSTGLTAGKYCNFCGTWIVEQIVIPVKHDYVYVGDGLNANGEYVFKYTCSKCDDEIEVIQ